MTRRTERTQLTEPHTKPKLVRSHNTQQQPQPAAPPSVCMGTEHSYVQHTHSFIEAAPAAIPGHNQLVSAQQTSATLFIQLQSERGELFITKIISNNTLKTNQQVSPTFLSTCLPFFCLFVDSQFLPPSITITWPQI